MSGFPGPHSASEFLGAQARRDREEARSEAAWPVAERSPDFHDITDSLGLRVALLKCTKADMMTSRELEKTVDALEAAIREIVRLNGEISKLRQQARKAGTSEAK